MKILYAVQGTGNGHLARAADIYPALCRYGETDVLVSGIQCDIQPAFPVKYRFHGLSFVFGSRGGVDKMSTFKNLRPLRLLREVFSLPVHQYDLVISDFELVSAWACKLRGKTCIALSHQSAVLHERAPKPAADDLFGRLVLKYYAPASFSFGFHFKRYAENIFTPVIRRKVRSMQVSDNGTYVVYLPAYDDAHIIKQLSVFKNIRWQVFSKQAKTDYTHDRIHVCPIVDDDFVRALASASGVLCGAGFETPAEALYLQKKLMVVPMHGQYEQQCNAACLHEMGVPVISKLSADFKNEIATWLVQDQRVSVHFPDNANAVADAVMERYWAFGAKFPALPA